ncbi:hypothetical protein CP533_0571 [Ophiocordyceps camponoti-saundersi (nom. inval.)]|nr:hypothetical protein CP533_0571 [Ophiocordyceps camponoti-saundersi (nom. inval.)]
MARLSLLALLALVTSNITLVSAAKNIPSPCVNNADCNSGCCAQLRGQGGKSICSGPAVGNDGPKLGCGTAPGERGGVRRFVRNAGAAQGFGAAQSAGAAQGAAAGQGNLAATAAKVKAAANAGEGPDNYGKQSGKQFITGICFNNRDCATACCAQVDNNTKKAVCSAVSVQKTPPKQGCGTAFGEGQAFPGGAGIAQAAGAGIAQTLGAIQASGGNQSSSTGGGAGSSQGNRPEASADEGPENFGNQQGIQFITGICFNNLDCKEGCCAKVDDNTGKSICSGTAVGNVAPKQGCGTAPGEGKTFQGNQTGSGNQGNQTGQGNQGNNQGGGGLKPDPAGEKNVGNGEGDQFIGGRCLSNADCQDQCCAQVGGQTFALCSGPGAANQSGKQGCGTGPNDGGNGGNSSSGSGNSSNSGGDDDCDDDGNSVNDDGGNSTSE